MKYWHMQLHPSEYGDWSVDDIKTILAHNLIGCSGDPVSLFYKIKIGDLVLVRHGGKILSLVKVTGKVRAFQEHEKTDFLWFDYCAPIEILSNYSDKTVSGEGWYLPKTLMPIENKIAVNYIFQLFQQYLTTNNLKKMEQIKSLLQYKKQIILQGPPGTGKTKLAKAIASIMTIPSEITGLDISKYIGVNLELKSTNKGSTYRITKINDNNLEYIRLNTNKIARLLFKDIIKAYHEKIWLNGGINNGSDTYSATVAKYIYEKFILEQDSELVNLVQFHPSYSYEDFVRGIVAQSEGDKIIYKNVNKTLGSFAKEALNNFINSQKDEETLSYEEWVASNFESFVDSMDSKLLLNSIELTDKVNIISLEDDAFRYKGKKGWSKLGNRMLFEDIIQAIVDENTTRKDLKQNKNLSGLAKWHASYYIRVVELFHSFVKERNLTYQKKSVDKIPLKNYVLIIDEINRANLSSVLGELIYALEYRGEVVKSIYEVDTKNDFIIPPNLYIIGTMNTADRSVGTIDYAIRRRFAFVDVLPKNLSPDLGDDYKSSLFTEVSKLFIENYDPQFDYSKKNLKNYRSRHLSEEFNPQDVWLGHSYFIQHYEKDPNGENIMDKPIDFNFRLDYEIKPILHEYIKDGILKESAFEIIENLTC